MMSVKAHASRIVGYTGHVPARAFRCKEATAYSGPKPAAIGIVWQDVRRSLTGSETSATRATLRTLAARTGDRDQRLNS